MEGKLATLDHARQGKEEQLRTLERKLVVLLEEQQRELHKIRRRQEARGGLLEDARTGDARARGVREELDAEAEELGVRLGRWNRPPSLARPFSPFPVVSPRRASRKHRRNVSLEKLRLQYWAASRRVSRKARTLDVLRRLPSSSYL